MKAIERRLRALEAATAMGKLRLVVLDEDETVSEAIVRLGITPGPNDRVVGIDTGVPQTIRN
jgi:hypothetical protein